MRRSSSVLKETPVCSFGSPLRRQSIQRALDHRHTIWLHPLSPQVIGLSQQSLEGLQIWLSKGMFNCHSPLHSLISWKGYLGDGCSIYYTYLDIERILTNPRVVCGRFSRRVMRPTQRGYRRKSLFPRRGLAEPTLPVSVLYNRYASRRWSGLREPVWPQLSWTLRAINSVINGQGRTKKGATVTFGDEFTDKHLRDACY